MEARVLIVAVGDPTAGKDAVGPLILDELRRGRLPPRVRAYALGRRPDRLVDLVAGEETTPPGALIILDAVTSRTEAPGNVVERELRPYPERPGALSSHGGAVGEALGLMRIALGDRAPRKTMVVGVTVGEDVRGPLTGVIRDAIPGAADRVREVLRLLA
jgi:hydrogenase maturation protease